MPSFDRLEIIADLQFSLLTGIPFTASGSPFGLLNVISVLASAAIAYIAWQAWTARPRVENGRETPTTAPPDDLHPAYAGVLASGRISDNQIEAAVLEMVRRRTLEIEPDQEQRSKVQIRILDRDSAANPVEEALLSVLDRRQTNGVVGYRTLSRLRNEWGDARATLRDQMVEFGWLDPSIIRTRLPFVVPGTIGLLMAAATIPGAFLVSSGWPLLGGALVGLTGSIVLVAGNIIPHTTAAGEREAIPWRGFRSGIIAARDEAQGELELDQLFPYIVAMGLAPGFERYLRRASQSGYIPEWIGPRRKVQEWPEGWHTYWIALHTAIAPTDPTNTTAPTGSPWRRSLTGGRF